MVADASWTVPAAASAGDRRRRPVGATTSHHLLEILRDAGRARRLADRASTAPTARRRRWRRRCSAISASTSMRSASRPTAATSTSHCGSTHLERAVAARGRERARAWAWRSTATATARCSSITRGKIVDGDAVLLMAADQHEGRRPPAGQRGRRDGDEQHRPRDRASRSRHRDDPHAGRRQVRDGGDGQRAASPSAASSRAT